MLLPLLPCRKLSAHCQAALKQENEEAKSPQTKAEVARRKCPCLSSHGLMSCPGTALRCSAAGCPLTVRHLQTNALEKRGKEERSPSKQALPGCP